MARTKKPQLAQSETIDALPAACVDEKAARYSAVGLEDISTSNLEAKYGITPEAVKFSECAERWRRERPWGADVGDLCAHEAYQEIIAMGEVAIPFILEELRRRPDYWFRALRAINRVDIVPPHQRGRVPEMTIAWLKWGKEHGHIQ